VAGRSGPRGGKATLPARRRYRETPEVVAATRRLIRVVGQQIATEDPDDLLLLRDLEQELGQAWATAVTGIRDSGFTDREIGLALGTTRQAVEQRWPRGRHEANDPGPAVREGDAY
jgi:hypothetical protein